MRCMASSHTIGLYAVSVLVSWTRRVHRGKTGTAFLGKSSEHPQAGPTSPQDSVATVVI